MTAWRASDAGRPSEPAGGRPGPRVLTRRPLLALLAGALVVAACSGGSGEIELGDRPDVDNPLTTAPPSGGDRPEATSTPAEETNAATEFPSGNRQGNAEAAVIHVDQFGYRPGDPKVAVIADPETGWDADISRDVGEVIEVRRVEDDEVVFSAEPQAWNEGELHEQSGDRGWWFDFGDLDEPGSYYVIDPAEGHRSHPFDIGDDVYDEVLRAALRMFWYNRGNIEHAAEFSGPWVDGPANVGERQDGEARAVDDQDNGATTRDLTGGWFDAGDTNKYVTFAVEPVHGLLGVYGRSPQLFDDELGIPESGNGVPDIVDEVKWETDWLEKMQLDDGSVLMKVGNISFEHELVPSAEYRPRFYEEACSSSTIAAAGMYAHAAVVFSEFPELAEDAERLEDRARQAWDWYQNNPRSDDCDPQEVKAGDADRSLEVQDELEVVAAVYLFALTGESRYHLQVLRGFDNTQPFVGEGFGHYRPEQADALLFYRGIPGADEGILQAIDGRIADLPRWSVLFGWGPRFDLYRAHMPGYMYHWGSNRVKANVGAANLLIGVGGGQERALGHLNYLHGVNPLGLVYLTNTGQLGAERSAQHIFHYWFGDRSEYDVNRNPEIGVPPGYLVGGPNQFYGGNGVGLADQPAQKAFADRAGYEMGRAWQLTEPAIYYQSAYLRLLAAVMDS